MDLSNLTTATVLFFVLLLTRISGMIVAAPFFTQTGVPMQVKVGIAAAISIILFPIYVVTAQVPATNLWEFTFLVGQELALGLLIGFTANLVFNAIQLAGHHVSTQMGLAMAQLIDPVNQQQSPVMAQYYFILAIFVFLSLNMHHTLVLAVARSLDVIPLAGGFPPLNILADRMMTLGGNMFSLSMMLVLPFMGIMLLMEVCIAYISKVMPQMNVFIVALPLKIAVGLLLMGVTLPFTLEVMTSSFEALGKHLLLLFQV